MALGILPAFLSRNGVVSVWTLKALREDAHNKSVRIG
jgi:hypothetical protein